MYSFRGGHKELRLQTTSDCQSSGHEPLYEVRCRQPLYEAALLALFASDGPREHDRQLYSKLTCKRAFVQHSMAASLLWLVYDAPPVRPPGCSSISNGFAVPLKEEYRTSAWALLRCPPPRWCYQGQQKSNLKS